MNRMLSLLFVFVMMLSGVAGAEAPDTHPVREAHGADSSISAAGAADLKKQVEDSMQWRFDMSKALGQGLTMDGNIEVTPKDSFYEVKLPNLSMLTGPRGKLNIGTVVLNATPLQPGAWQVQATLPSSMTFLDATNAPTARFVIGKQHFSGVWWPEKEVYPTIDSLFENIQVTGVDKNPVTATIGTIKFLVDLKDNGDNTWSGPVSFEAANVNLTVPGPNAVTFMLGKISSHSAYDRLDMSKALEMKKTLQDALKNGPPKTDKDKQALLAKLFVKSPTTINSMDSTFNVDKLLVHDTGNQQQPQRSLSLSHLVLYGSTSHTQQEKSNLLLKAAFDGLNVSSIPASLMGLMPHSFNAEISLENMPMNKMTDLLFNTVQKSVAANTSSDTNAQNQAKADAAASAALLPQMLKDAGASITVQNTFIKSTALETNLNGKVETGNKPDESAAGKMVLSIQGLDEFIKQMKASALQTDADPNTLGYLGAIIAVQMKGQQGKSPDGKSLRNYVFELTKDGRTLLNGTDLGVPPAASQGNKGMVTPQTQPMTPAPAPTTTPAATSTQSPVPAATVPATSAPTVTSVPTPETTPAPSRIPVPTPTKPAPGVETAPAKQP